MFSDTRRISTITKPGKSTEAIFIVDVEETPSLSHTPKIEISIDLTGIYGKEGYPTPGEGSFVDLLNEGVWSRQLKVQGQRKYDEMQVVGHLFLYCKNINPPGMIPDGWGADFWIRVSDFNEIFKTATQPYIRRQSRIFKLINKSLTKNGCGFVSNITFLGYH